MTQAELERAIAQETGESLRTIRHRGFTLINTTHLPPLMVDWDELETERWSLLPRGPAR